MNLSITEDGYRGPWGMADYVVVPARRCIKISPDLAAGEAGFLEPLATVSKGIKILGVQPQDTVVVIGAGTMGLLNAITLKARNCRVIITEMMENKIANAKAEGLEVVDCNSYDPVAEVKRLTNGKGADAVVVAVGSTSANNQAAQMLKQYYGKILVFAACYPEPHHATTFEYCNEAVNAGFSSVMIDASALSFEENVEVTRKVARSSTDRSGRSTYICERNRY